FQRGVGDTTDIVQKEMYSFVDKGENYLTLKPESTAAVVRAYIEHRMDSDIQPVKLYYISPTFRYERPESGRQRQFHQFGIEIFGSDNPSADVEVISAGYELIRRMGIKNVKLHINTLGDVKCRKKYNEILSDFLESKKDHLCSLCNDRRIKNPLRTLDCKNENCQNELKTAPTILNVIGDECKAHFEEVKTLLTAMKIPFIVDTSIVRGLDYYTKTVFEFIAETPNFSGTICGGGRYNTLVEQIGGKKTPAVGFGAGMERLLLIQGDKEILKTCDVFLGYRGKEGKLKAFTLINELRKQGISAESDNMERSVKAQMKFANKIGAKFSAIIGEEEIINNKLSLKNMSNGEIFEVDFSKIIDIINY
ncbi:MAG: histidine--tRNA ligase, partial [Candidatus Epulonipiscium fishelsonii]